MLAPTAVLGAPSLLSLPRAHRALPRYQLRTLLLGEQGVAELVLLLIGEGVPKVGHLRHRDGVVLSGQELLDIRDAISGLLVRHLNLSILS